MGPKSLSVPLAEARRQARQRSHGRPAERASTAVGEPSTQCWHSAAATVGTGVSSGRHGRAEESRGRRSEGGVDPRTQRTCEEGLASAAKAREVEKEQRHLLRKQPLEEDDNGPMTLERLAVPDGQLAAAAGPLFF
ncbi:hypothetical protein GCM10009540_95300 [Streptomyces turgidiscabies]